MLPALARPSDWRLGYRPGLDAIRGIAILMVVAYHADLVPVGYFGATGVTVFFVLSGFLITRLLMQETDQQGRINLRAFYVRRARRLLPALVLMLVVVTALQPHQLGSALWALSYAANWALVADVELVPFEHAWSLSIEEQFYVLWPLAFIIGWRFRSVGMILLVLLLIRALVPVDGAFISFSTLTQAPSLLMGVVLAFVHWEPIRSPWLWASVGLTGLTLSALLPVTDAPNRIRDPLAAMATVPLMMACYQGLFAWRPLVALGRISYGVYLWHAPVMILSGTWRGAEGWLPALVAVAASVAIAAVSYVVIERPLLRSSRVSGVHAENAMREGAGRVTDAVLGRDRH